MTLQRIVLHYHIGEPIRCIHGCAEGIGTLPSPQRFGNKSAERIARALGLLLSMACSPKDAEGGEPASTEAMCGVRPHALFEIHEICRAIPDLSSFPSSISYGSPRWADPSERLPGMRKGGADLGGFEQGHLGSIGERRR